LIFITETTKHSLHCPNCGAAATEDATSCPYCHSILSVTSCPNCFGAVFKGMKYCSWCGVAINRNEVKSDKKLVCPRCEHILRPVDFANARVHECESCGGLWLNVDTFKSICDDKEKQEMTLAYVSPVTAELNPNAPHSRMYVPCPECKELMLQKNFLGCAGVIIDWCKDHGTWFDYNELHQIVLFIKSGGVEKAKKLEIEHLNEEIRSLKDKRDADSIAMTGVSSYQDVNYDTSIAKIISKIFKI